MAIDLQRRFRYTVQITSDSFSEDFTNVAVDEFTPPDSKRDAVTSQNAALGQINLVGPATFSEMTLRLALRVTDGADINDVYVLIKSLEDLNDADLDTCDIVLSTTVDISGVQEVSYSQSYGSCRVTGYKLDQLGRKDDGDFLHIDLTLIPSSVGKVIYEFGA